MVNILQLILPNFLAQFSDVFYIGRKKLPISVRKNNNGYTVKLGSGFASYTLDTTKDELTRLSQFIENFLSNNP